MLKDEMGNVRITVIEVNGTNDLLVESIRAAVSNRTVNQQRTVRPFDATLEVNSGTGSQFGDMVTDRVSQAALSDGQLETPAVHQTLSQTHTIPKKRARASSKGRSNPQQSTAGTARQSKIKEITQASVFEDYERYTAAIGKKDIGYLNQAALVARLAQTKFEVADGLAPSEILQILKDRFSINRDRKAMENALRNAPRTFFSVSPAPFHHRAKLYRPMKDCIERVEELLNEFNHARLDAESTEGEKAAAAKV